jgi:hypothetical protein
MEKHLWCCFLALDVSSGSFSLAFLNHVTVLAYVSDQIWDFKLATGCAERLWHVTKLSLSTSTHTINHNSAHSQCSESLMPSLAIATQLLVTFLTTDNWLICCGQVICCCPLPTQSFLVLGPMGHITIFFGLMADWHYFGFWQTAADLNQQLSWWCGHDYTFLFHIYGSRASPTGILT